jgi:hypothetical protein
MTDATPRRPHVDESKIAYQLPNATRHYTQVRLGADFARRFVL